MNAYLILAHSQPQQLGRLINAIDHETVDIYVHVDKSADLEKFITAVKAKSNVFFIEKRKTVTWMGYSTVVATLELLKVASSSRRYEYYSLISGADYPVKSNDYIAEYLQQSSEQLLSFWKLDDRRSWLHKIERYHHVDLMPIRGPEHKPYLHGYYWKLHHRCAKFIPKRKFVAGMEPYGGSPWWSLTHDCVLYVLDFVSKNEKFCNFFKYTLCPDDMFFQTVILNSPFADSSKNFTQYTEWSEQTAWKDKISETAMLPEDSFNLRYIDWSGEVDGNREIPALLDDRDFKKIVDSHCLFARKFDKNVSRCLLNRIDSEIR